MVTPPAIPANDGRRRRAASSCCGSRCLRRSAPWSRCCCRRCRRRWMNPLPCRSRRCRRPRRARPACGFPRIRTSILSREATRRRQELRRTSCEMAFAAEPNNLQFKVAVARAMPHAQRAEEARPAARGGRAGHAEANYEIYELHKSWDRGDLDKAPMVPRAEADRALRKAAELGHPFSTQMLAILLDRGTTVKRDPVAARYWAERALDNPAKDESRGSLQVFLGRLLVNSEQTGGTRPRSGDTRTTERARALPVRRQDRTGARDPQGRPGARAEAARRGAQSRSRRRDAAAGGNADRGRRRPGRPEARAEAAEGPERHRRREGRARASLSRRQTGAARCPGSGEPDRHGRRMGPRRAAAGRAVARRQSRGAGHASQATCSTTRSRPPNSTNPGR